MNPRSDCPHPHPGTGHSYLLAAMKNRLLPDLKPEPESDTVLLEEPADGNGPAHLTASQAAAFAKLSAMAELACHPVRYSGVAVRAVPLLLGRTGVGKTAVISRLAHHLGTPGHPLPMLHLTGPGWVIVQSKAEPPTLTVVRAFIQRHGRLGRAGKPAGLIFLDEADKRPPQATGPGRIPTAFASRVSSWPCWIGMTVFFPAGWSHQDVARLRDYMIIGAGAWQRVADRSLVEGESHLDLVEQDPVIPVEIARRFSTMIEVKPPTQKDFTRILARLYDDLGLPDPSHSLVEVVAEAAASSGKGMRWLEAHLLDVLVKYPALRKPVPEADTIKEERPVVTPAVFEAACMDAYGQMAAVEPMLAFLAAQVRLHADHLFPAQEDFFPPGQPSPVVLLEKIGLLQVGLRIRYARSAKGRALDSDCLWKQGHAVCAFISMALENDLKYLQEHKLIGLFTQTQVRVSRILSAWEYICTVEPVAR